MLDNNLEIERLLRQLPEVATLKVCSAWLKSKGLTYSASGWPEMIDKRFRKSLSENSLTREDVAQLVHECEEYSNKRVHLFQTKSGLDRHPIFSVGGIQKHYPKLKNWPKFGERSIAKIPTGQQILEVRIDEAHRIDDERSVNIPRALVLKVGTREMRRVLVDETRQDNGREVLVYERRAVPVVYVVRLFEDGVLEIRMDRESEDHAYLGTASAIWTAIGPLVNRANYTERPIHGILGNLWDQKSRTRLEKSFGIERSDHENGLTKIITTVGKPNSVLSEDPNIIATIDLFHKLNSGPTRGCKGAFIKTMVTQAQIEAGLLPLMVQIHGLQNEFSVWAKCRKADYDLMLFRLLRET